MCGLPASWPCSAQPFTRGPCAPPKRFTQIRIIHGYQPKNTQRRGIYCSAENSTSSAESSAPSSPLTSAWPRQPLPGGAPAAPDTANATQVCRECGGRRVIRTSAGPLPCSSCVPWRRRPEYAPGQLITEKDLNLSLLDSESDTDTENEGESGTTIEDAPKPKQRRGEMTEEKRMAIKVAMQNRGPLPADHKRRISNAMRARYASDPSIRQAGRAKRCSHCGKEGHNRKTCPELTEVQLTKTEQVQRALESMDSNHQGKTRCSICGQTGHNKRSCPVALEQQQRAQDASSGADSSSLLENGTGQLIDAEHRSSTKSIATTENTKKRRSRKQSNASSSSSDEEESRNTTTPMAGDGDGDGSGDPSIDEYLAGPVPEPVEALRLVRALPGADISLSEDGSIVFPLPLREEQCVEQAAGAVRRAWDDGIRRQSLELLLPQENSVVDAGWPGGIRQQFRAALPMVEGLLLRLKRSDGLEGRITAEWLDEGDCVGAWQSERLAAVVFPTAEALRALQRIDDALSGRRLLLVVNPQWQPEGQVVSDFGFGNTRRAAERFVGSLEDVYYLRRFSVMGDEVRVLRCYPGLWQVHYIRSTALEPELLALEDEKPTYQRLLDLLRGVRGSLASKPWLDRMMSRNVSGGMANYTKGRGDGGGGGVVGEVGVNTQTVVNGEEVERDIVTGEVLRK